MVCSQLGLLAGLSVPSGRVSWLAFSLAGLCLL